MATTDILDRAEQTGSVVSGAPTASEPEEDKRVRSIALIEDVLGRGAPGMPSGRGRGRGVFPGMPRRTRIRFLGDVAVMLAVTIGVSLYLDLAPRYVLMLLGFDAVYLLALHIAGVYTFGEAREGRLFYAFRFLVALGAAFFVIFPLAFLPYIAREAGVQALLTLILLGVWRRAIEGRLALAPVRVAVVGAGSAASLFLKEIGQHAEFDVAGVFDDDAARPEVEGHEVVGDCGSVPRFAVESGVELVVVAITHGRGPGLVEAMLACQYAGIPVVDMPAAFELITGRLPLEHCSANWFAFSAHVFDRHSGLAQRGKRTVDVVLALLGLLGTAPLVILAALAVRLESRGPAFYRQVRVGRYGRPFRIAKLRTMRTDAEAGSGAVWAGGTADPRVTRVGRLLRALRLDELPQFWNVLVGDMSMVGPRPERPEFVRTLSEEVPFYGLRHGVRPGLTGWAQVRYPYGASIEDALRKLEYDLFYVRHYTPLFDLRIMLRTIRVMVLGAGGG